MAQPITSLLVLPGEVRNKIWEYAAANGAWATLMSSCRQFCEEISWLCDLPDDLEHLEQLTIVIDSNYVRGVWLEARCEWFDGDRARVLSKPVQDLDDPWMTHIGNIPSIRHIQVRVVAPKNGQFFGAFMMLFAKSSDVSNWILPWREHLGVHDDDSELSSLRIVFETESSTPEAPRASSFWTCRWEEELLDNLRRVAFKDHGKPPYCYEYFLIFFSTLGGTGSPVEIVLDDSIQRDNSTLIDGPYRRIIEDLPEPSLCKQRLQAWESHRPTTVRNFTSWVSRWGMRQVIRNSPNALDGNGWVEIVAAHIFAIIACEHDNISYHLSIYLDHHTGPPGGPMDMLRLHRFKTLHRSRSNFFACLSNPRTRSRPVTTMREDLDEVTHRFYQLFNPLAPKQIRDLRHTCKHFQSIDWPMAAPEQEQNTETCCELSQLGHMPSLEPARCSRSLWIESYPNGVSYGQGPCAGSAQGGRGNSLASWRNKWELYSHPEVEEDWVRRTWECLMCCDDAAPAWMELCTMRHKTHATQHALAWWEARGNMDKEPFDMPAAFDNNKVMFRHQSYKFKPQCAEPGTREKRRASGELRSHAPNDYQDWTSFLVRRPAAW